MSRVIQILLATMLVLIAGLPALLAPRCVAGLSSHLFEARWSGFWLAAGLIAGALTYLSLRRTNRGRFLDTLQHELSHTLFALILGASPTAVAAQLDHGSTSYKLGGPLSDGRTFLISISPYWFSPLLIVSLILAALTRPHGAWVATLAVLTGLALVAPLSQIHPTQSDLTRYGFIFPLLPALWLWTATFVLSVDVLRAGSLGVIGHDWIRAWRLLIPLL